MSIKKQIKPPGIEDIFPNNISAWNFVINTAKSVFNLFNVKEVIIPIMEYTDVFTKGIGTDTDIVSKEMFSFEDRGGRNLTLRPEGTASIVRAYVENGDFNRLAICKFFYCGPMFRAEKPQKGRLRQFNQFGAETFGSNNPFYDFEIISIMDSITKKLGVSDYSLLINSIGCSECRAKYIEELKKYYKTRIDTLCNDCKKRLDKNPLRLLDCKNEKCIELKNDAPRIINFLCNDCEEHHNSLKNYLDAGKIKYFEDPLLVRGLDYYTKTTFEFVSANLGGQNAFAAGGRYDNLVEESGGKSTPAVGFAAGIERLLLLVEESKTPVDRLDVYLVYSGEEAYKKTLYLSNMLRDNNISIDMDPGFSGMKSQFKKADREKAIFTIIIGDSEIKNGNYSVKIMDTGEQETFKIEKLLLYIKSVLKK